MDVPEKLRALTAHSVEFSGTSGNQMYGTCPLCGESKFYANKDTGQWDCKKCGEEGNVYTFLKLIAELYYEETEKAEWRRLAKDRGLPTAAFKRWGLGWDGKEWLIPSRAKSGLVHDIRRWRPRHGRIRSTPGCKAQLFGSDQLAKAASDVVVWICEGEWDAIALSWLIHKAKRPDVVVAVPGANTFKQAWVSLFQGRTVRLCYDHDDAGRSGTSKATRLLAGRARRIHTIDWPERKPDGFDVRDYVIAKLKKERSATAILRSLEMLLVRSESNAQPTEDVDLELSDPHRIASQILSCSYQRGSKRTLQYWQGQWWSWQDSRYRNIPAKEMRAQINKQIRELLDAHKSLQRVVHQLVTNVLDAVSSICVLKGTVSLGSWIGNQPRSASINILAVRNGLLSLALVTNDEEDPILKHSPDWFSLTCLPYGYDANAKCPQWIRFLKEVLPHRSERWLLQEFVGYCLSPDTRYHKFLILVGEGANGKSVVTSVVTELLGRDNVSNVGLDQFGARFAMAPTIGKLANIVSEIGPLRGVAEHVLKAIVSGDPFRVEFKNQTPFEAKPTVRLIFATNELPHFVDRSEGIWRRLLILPFGVTIPEDRQDRRLADHITRKELSGILNWALGGLKRLRGNDKFTIPKSTKRAITTHRKECDPDRDILTKLCVEKPGKRISSAVLYHLYRNECFKADRDPLKEQQFGRQVHRVFPGVRRKQRRDGRRRPYFYFGLMVRSGSRSAGE